MARRRSRSRSARRKRCGALGRMADAREGVQSFLEKRKPRFTLSPTKDAPTLDPLD